MIIALQTLIFFRESLLSALDRLLRPYYNRFSLVFSRTRIDSNDDESEEQVFSEYDDEKGVVFFPPVYSQRYAAVSDCLMDERWCGKLEKVIDLGYHDMSFIKYLKEVPGVKCILGVDIESLTLRCSSDLFCWEVRNTKNENPMQITLFQGNASDPDYRLIGCDAVISIEMIEHMLPQDLERLVHTVFGFVKPQIAIFTTPNGDFNVLFKALESNGLRRLDHFFEWTREQFNDWCSNIVLRYPQYTVTCRGIGPGPPGTNHLGCCSQMALFVCKDYHKQQDLNLDSLVLVSTAPKANSLNDMISSFEIVDYCSESNILPNIIESYTDLLFSEKQSAVTIVLSTPNFSLDSLKYQDKTSQCNLDSEVGRNFLMFDDEQLCFNIVVPRRNVHNKIYEIEDLNSRLNCTTLQINKFSKTTQNLMEKNRIDSSLNTREVVDEIRNLTEMLNFKKDGLNKRDVPYMWNNINWGDNAPYWNQYYKIVREYNYPFERKPDECRILDLVSDEIMKMIDMQCEDELSVEANKFEIPLHHLMSVVQHITNDIDKIKDLLEWHGYEIVDDTVIYSRPVVDDASVASREDVWQDNDTFSDWDTTVTEYHSASLSIGSAILPDYYDRCVRRALDNKVRKLRSMLTADEDITTELDRVVCKLMKLALRTSRGRQNPPSTRWLQCKLLDLLTLTENAIDRRKRHFIETYPLRAIAFDTEEKPEEIITSEIIKDDDTASKIINRYQHLIQPTVTVLNKEIEEFSTSKYIDADMEIEDVLSVTSTDFLKEFDYVDRESPSLIDPELIFNETVYESINNEGATKFDRVLSWIDEDMEEVLYSTHNSTFDNSSGDTDHSSGFVSKATYKKSYKRIKSVSGDDCKDLCLNKIYKSHVTNNKQIVSDTEKNTNKIKPNKSKVIKKVTRKKSNSNNMSINSKNKTIRYKNFDLRSKNRRVYNYSTPSKPIPESLIELCNSELSDDKNYDKYNDSFKDDGYLKNDMINNNISATEESFLIDIVTDGMEETIALRRTIGTEAEVDSDCTNHEFNETLIQCINNETNDKIFEELEPCTENVQSQTIFLNDIYEPSTSKGIRHNISMDVQCGLDNADQLYSTLSTSVSTSYTKIPKLNQNEMKTSDLCTTFKSKTIDSGTYMDENNDYDKIITPNFKSVIGICIRDSDQILAEKIESGTVTKENTNTETIPIILQNLAPVETKLLKSVPSKVKTEGSSFQFFGSIDSLPKSPLHYETLKYPNDVTVSHSLTKEDQISNKLSLTQYKKPQLCCGGVHIHSYKEKQMSEDVFYQGEWQKYRTKPLVKKESLSSDVPNKSLNPFVKKNNAAIKNMTSNIINNKKEVNYVNKRYIQPRNTVLHKPRKISMGVKNEKVLTVNKIPKLTSITKMLSKHAVSSVSSKLKKLMYYTPKKPAVMSTIAVKNDSNVSQHRPLVKTYIPTYLRKRGIKLPPSNNRDLNASLDSVERRKKSKIPVNISCFVRSNTDEIKSDLLKFHPESCEIDYLVFRNEIDNENSVSSLESITEEKRTNKNNASSRQHSPQSQNSSTCSSLNSVATIRIVSKKAKTVPITRSVPHRNIINSSGSETPSPSKLNKYTKRVNSYKSTNKPANKNFDNKENLSKSPKSNFKNKKNDKIDKNVFKGSQKNVFIAQFNTDSKPLQPRITSLSKPTSQCSSFKIPSSNNINVKVDLANSSISMKDFFDSENILYNDCNENKMVDNNNSDKRNSLKKPLTERKVVQEIIQNVNSDENNLLDHLETNSDVMENNSNEIRNSIKQLLEQILNFFENPLYKNIDVGSKRNVCGEDTVGNYDDNSSTASFKSIRTDDNTLNSTLDMKTADILNNSFDTTLADASILSLANTNTTITDLDLLSFKSIASETKLSNDFFDGCDFNSLAPKNNSVREIFERKGVTLTQNPGALAIQAFSGFSINDEPFVGEEPDPINFIDSETGSRAFEVSRRANSEELFISGRSSDSFESCVIEEDAVVPNWLFNIISQQHSSTTEEQDSLNMAIPLPLEGSMPLAESVFDTNANMEDPMAGADAGAGDGRGIHSDSSQDSSGRGTSLSSSDTSSGQQSEAIIIDASAFLEQFEPIGESTLALSVLPNEATVQLDNTNRFNEERITSSSQLNREDIPTHLPLMAASDVDADVSSLDTDVPDSSDD